MSTDDSTTALVALLRAGGRAWAGYVMKARAAGAAGAIDPQMVLEEELGLLAYDALEQARAELEAWQGRGIRVLALTDPDYPQNLTVVPGRPPLLFVVGELKPADSRAVAVIGSRSPTPEGLRNAAQLADALGRKGFTVVSGLAAGIDAAAHRAALSSGERTLAVIGTGVDRAYPAEHVELQRQIAAHGAVVSQFWPDAGPTKQSFPARNRVMSGLTLASVIVEASATSGTRVQARHALEQGRKVILMRAVLQNEWAAELCSHAGVHVAGSADEVNAILGA